MLGFQAGLPRNSRRKKVTLPRILVVDDDSRVRDVLREGLSNEGWIVHEASNRAELLETIRTHDVDLITLDLSLQHEDGLAIARELRSFRNVPILMITGRGAPFDRVTGLEHGADDYVAKPFLIREVVLRIRRLLGTYRQPLLQSEPIRFDHSTLDPNRGVVDGPDGVSVGLTWHEQKLLQLFAMNPNRVLSRDDIAIALTGREWSPMDRTIDVHVAHLRRKLANMSDVPKMIRSVRGVGYVFTAEVHPVA
nr:response regulator transcription factor [Rhodobacter amnigenus]